MAKKDMTDAVKNMANANLNPVLNLLRPDSSNLTEESVKTVEQVTVQKADEESEISNTSKKITKKVSKGRPVGTTKPVAELKKNTIVLYFSDIELKNIENAGIMQSELAAILRLRLKEMGVNIAIR